MSLLAQRYAKALFEVAAGASAEDAVGGDLARLAEVLADPAVGTVALSPDTPSSQRRQVLDKILTGAHQLTQNLVGVVLQRRREAILPDLSAAFTPLLLAARGTVVGSVETAKPLDTEGLQALEARAEQLAGKKVALDVHVNPDLIGGVRIRVGNTLYDGSVATALEDLERRLMEAPI